MTNHVAVLFQRQVTTAVLTAAIVFLATWVIPNQLVLVLLIKFAGTNDGAALKLRFMMSIGAFEEESFSTTTCLAAIAAQLNSCFNFFVYAFRHNEFRRHLRFMCGMGEDPSQTISAALSAKAGMSPVEA